MAEARRPEVDLFLGRLVEVFSSAGSGEEGHLKKRGKVKSAVRKSRAEMETHDEVLKQTTSPCDLVIRAGCEVTCLLKKHGIGPVDLANVDWYPLRSSRRINTLPTRGAGDELTFFCAEKMQFMMGMY